MLPSLQSLVSRLNSLRFKIVLSLIGLSIFSAALGGLYSRFVLIDRFQDVIEERGSAEFARDVAGYYRNNGSSFALAEERESWADHIAELERDRPEKANAEVRENNSHFIATDLEGIVRIPNGNYATGDQVSADELINAIPILNIFNSDGATEVIGYVLIEGELILTGAEAQYSSDLIRSLWIAFFLVTLVAAPIGVFLGTRLTRRINGLTNAIRAMRPSTMQQRVPVTSNDEIGLLSQSFNDMSQELAGFVSMTEVQHQKILEAEAMRREGLVSISHELRTPLYRSVAHAYAMLDGVRPLDASEMVKLAESLDHLSDLVNDLHQLALADDQAFSCTKAPVDFAAIVLAAVEVRSEVFAKHGFKLALSVPTTFVVNGDATRLRQIVDNLLANCIRYSDPHGNIRVSLIDNAGWAQLQVSDDGPGVAEASLERLFDRFYREESSRSRTTGGSGLGLSLVKACAELHDGTVSAARSPQGGLEITVRIPV